MAERKTRSSKSKVKLPDGWIAGEFDEHNYVIYECGCSHHKVIEHKTHECRKKWKHCKQHRKKLDEAQKFYDAAWNSIMDGPIRKRSRPKVEKASGSGTPRLPSISEK